ncbi:MAG: hypothetical protein V3W34_16920 [Phycisphaerae bacterium]
MRKCCCTVVAVLVLGLLGAPALGQSTCNGGTDCPDVLITPISATGSFNDLSDPDNLTIAVGNSFLAEINVDGRSFPAVDVVAADFLIDIVVNSGSGLNCVDLTNDASRSDHLFGTCSLCGANCGPPGVAGGVDTSPGGGQTVDFLAYAAEMTLICKDAGSFTLEFGGTAAKTFIASSTGKLITIIDDPTHFESINVACFNPCSSDADCEDNDACTDNVCNVGTAQCSFPQSAAAAACEAQSDPVCATFECNSGTGDCDKVDSLCNDNDACTDNICNAGTGQCSFPQSAAAVACEAQSDAPCATFQCNAGTGGCDDLSSNNDGAACTDNNSCTDGDACLAGICDPGELILGRVCAVDSNCDNVAEGIPADPGSCVGIVLKECTCPVATPAPTVVGDIGSRYVQITPDMSNTDAVALRVECNGVIEWVELTPALTDYDDGPQGLVNVGIGRSTCNDSYFLTPDAWTSSGANPLYVTGLSVAPASRPTVYAVSGGCTTPRDSDPARPTSPTWIFGDSSGDGQVTFFADLFRQFSNNPAVGFPFFTGPDPGVEVDTQGNTPTVPDQQITGFADTFQCFQATMAGGGATWTGQVCP